MPNLLSIEFTDIGCKVALVNQAKSGRVTVQALSSFPLTRPDDAAARIAERAQALKEHLRAQKLSTKQAVVIIPKNFVMARSVNLPSTVDEEITGMARFEADRHIPFNAERHVVAYHILEKKGAQGSDVLLTAVDQPIAQEYLDICVKAGLEVVAITVSSVAMFNAFSTIHHKDIAEKTVMVVNIGNNATDLIIAVNGNVTYSRGTTTGVSKLLNELNEATGKTYTADDLRQIDALEPHLFFADAPARPTALGGENAAGDGSQFSPTGTGSDSAADDVMNITILPPPSVAVEPANKGAITMSDWLNRLLQELKRTFEFANREFSCPMIDHIYLTGEGTGIKNLSQYLTTNFSIESTVFDPFEGSEVASKVRKSGVTGHAYAIAIGGSLGRQQPGTVNINLLPASYTEAKAAKKQQTIYIAAGILVLAVLGGGYYYLSGVFTQKEDELSELMALNRKDKERVDDLQTKKERLRIISENVQDDRGALAILGFISSREYFPDQATITTFDYKRGDYVNLSGDARDIQTANMLISDLKKADFFASGELTDVTQGRILRGRPEIPVLGWSAQFQFPKPQKQTSRSSSRARNTEEDELDGIE